ncbi:hypothetical protein KC332_g20 [Hortaea werneckii]|nr:hypothetical protein KC332_g20 [Hortaea werneckii]
MGLERDAQQEVDKRRSKAVASQLCMYCIARSDDPEDQRSTLGDVALREKTLRTGTARNCALVSQLVIPNIFAAALMYDIGLSSSTNKEEVREGQAPLQTPALGTRLFFAIMLVYRVLTTCYVSARASRFSLELLASTCFNPAGWLTTCCASARASCLRRSSLLSHEDYVKNQSTPILSVSPSGAVLCWSCASSSEGSCVLDGSRDRLIRAVSVVDCPVARRILKEKGGLEKARLEQKSWRRKCFARRRRLS